MFDLPKHTQVNKSIPKNAFDNFTNTKQKRLITESIDKIKWINKLSTSTTNLPHNEIEEVQLFKIELKKKVDIKHSLEIIDKSIPYHIIFLIYYDGEVMLSLSKKHPHPSNNTSVVDWSFQTNWIKKRILIIKYI